ncbi:acyltransferase [Candidatus Beckwithbacteria bacterium]|nr:acyltransferase [Candidatus Beckwithbacteria bacterium]
MKQRLTALDGLRGFAAFSVFLSHSNFDIKLFSSFPVLVYLFKFLQVGPNSVQILFVLCGFLMAYLYSEIPDIKIFYQKRYTRIFPVFAVICLGLFSMSLFRQYNTWFGRLISLALIALLYSGLWTLIRKLDKSYRIGKIIFWFFILLQIGTLLFDIYIIPHFTSYSEIIMPPLAKNVFTFLTNLTLSTPFIKNFSGYYGHFWSLAPEVLFYLLFPLVVLPLLFLTKKKSSLGPIVLLVIIKILFDLDKASFAFNSLSGVHFGRGTGFLFGVLVGHIYQNKGYLWKKIEKIFSLPFVNILLLLAFIFIQISDDLIRHGASYQMQNWYYLVSSFVIALLIFAAIIPKTLVCRIFSHKILIFYGLISYSLYLIHPMVIESAVQMFDKLMPFTLSQQLVNLGHLLISLPLSTAVAFGLYYLIERLYFTGKVKIKAIPISKLQNKTYSKSSIVLGFLIVCFLTFFIYSGSYAPSLLVYRHKTSDNFLKFNGEQTLLNNKIQIPFQAKEANLAIIYFTMRYSKDAYQTAHYKKEPATLVFRLLDSEKKLIFESKRSAYDIEGEPHFPFATPLLSDSAGKHYYVQLELLHGDKNDQVLANLSHSGMVSAYKITKNELIKKPYMYVLNRFFFVLQNPDALFVLAFAGLVSFALIVVKKT